jgi:hypothetical protein
MSGRAAIVAIALAACSASVETNEAASSSPASSSSSSSSSSGGGQGGGGGASCGNEDPSRPDACDIDVSGAAHGYCVGAECVPCNPDPCPL